MNNFVNIPEIKKNYYRGSHFRSFGSIREYEIPRNFLYLTCKNENWILMDSVLLLTELFKLYSSE